MRPSTKLHIATAVIFLLGAAAWFGARIWTFDNFRPRYVFSFALAVALAIAVVRGSVFYRWFTLVISSAYAYSSFSQFVYLNSKGTAGDAFILPGALFSLCSAILIAALLTGYLQTRQTGE